MAYSETVFVGNLTKDPELRVTQTGKSVCSFSVAVKRRYQDAADFHNCVAWGGTAEAIHKYFQKGKEILVAGELQNESYEKDGVKRWSTKLVVERFSFTGRKEQNGEASGGDYAPEGFSALEDDDLPF